MGPQDQYPSPKFRTFVRLRVMLIAKIYFRKAKSATREDTQVKSEGNQVQTSLSSPSGVTQDVLNPTSNEL